MGCLWGNGYLGVRFRGCGWVRSWATTPRLLSKCELKSLESWELTHDSTCTVETAWGPQVDGAGPGAECVVFAQVTRGTHSETIHTPWGAMNAELISNSGHPVCRKALPPNVNCEISLPPVIDHGIVKPGDSSRREDYGVINCGGSPKVDVLVNGDTDKDGVKIKASAHVDTSTQLRIVSEVSVGRDTNTGGYSAAYVFVASPY